MASINGVEIKNLKGFKGHDGESLYQGTIYLNGEKLGFWSQDSWGGCDMYDFDTSPLKKAVTDFQQSFPDSFPLKTFFTEPDVLLAEIIFWKDLEKTFKKYQKDGYKAMVSIVDKEKILSIPAKTISEMEEITKEHLSHLDELKKDNKALTVFSFTSINDFCIVFDENHPAKDYMMMI